MRASGGYVVAPPSVVTSGGSYVWEVDLDDCTPPPAPEWLIGLIMTPARAEACPDMGGDDKIQTLIDESRQPGRWHDSALRLTAHLVAIGTPPSAILAMAAELTMPGYTVEQTRRELQTMLDGARAKGWMPHPPCSDETLDALLASGERKRQKAAQDDDIDPADAEAARTREDGADIPLEFWKTSSILAEIRNYAHARYASADAVLGNLFALIAANISPETAIATFMHPRTAPNFFACIIGDSESGKGHAATVAREIFSALNACEEAPIGTGQGIAEAFMGITQDSNGKPIKTQVRYNALFKADEAAGIVGLLAAKDYDLADTLCKAFVGETLGRKNATTETTRVVSNYRLGLRVSAQPHLIASLIEHSAIGLVGRFTFFSATDPSAADRCGIQAECPRVRLQALDQITCSRTIHDESHAIRVKALTGAAVANPLEKHRLLVLHKLSFMLMFIEGRSFVDDHDWSRAKEYIWPTSCAVRDFAIHKAEEEKAAQEAESSNIYAGRHAACSDYAARVGAIALRVLRYISQRPEASKRQVRDACVSTARGERPLFDAAYAKALQLKAAGHV